MKITSTTRFVVCKSGLTGLDCNIIQFLINSSFFKDLRENERAHKKGEQQREEKP